MTSHRARTSRRGKALVAVVVSGALAAAGVAFGVSAASASQIGSITFNNLSSQAVAFTMTTSGGCPDVADERDELPDPDRERLHGGGQRRCGGVGEHHGEHGRSHDRWWHQRGSVHRDGVRDPRDLRVEQRARITASGRHVPGRPALPHRGLEHVPRRVLGPDRHRSRRGDRRRVTDRRTDSDSDADHDVRDCDSTRPDHDVRDAATPPPRRLRLHRRRPRRLRLRRRPRRLRRRRRRPRRSDRRRRRPRRLRLRRRRPTTTSATPTPTTTSATPTPTTTSSTPTPTSATPTPTSATPTPTPTTASATPTPTTTPTSGQLGTMTFNNLTAQDVAFTLTTSGGCPTSPTNATNFQIRIANDTAVAGNAAAVVSANITGNTAGATIGGGINAGPFTATASAPSRPSRPTTGSAPCSRRARTAST